MARGAVALVGCRALLTLRDEAELGCEGRQGAGREGGFLGG